MSKSVTLNTSDASTGRKKKTKIRSSAGARKNHAARPTSDGVREVGRTVVLTNAPQADSRQHPLESLAHSSRPSGSFCLSQKVSPLLEHRVHVLIERRQSLILGLGSSNR